MFLHNIAWIGGKDNQILARNRLHEPEVVSLALDLVEQRSLIGPAERGMSIEENLGEIWEQMAATSIRHRGRLRTDP